MNKIIWNERFSVGVSKIDDQHKKLIRMINMLIENYGAGYDSEIVSDLLTELVKYSQYHFDEEERYMIEADYPDYQAHEALHEEFIEKISIFCMDVMEAKDSVSREMLTYLSEWLKNHILVSDMHYKPFLSNK